MLSNRSCLNESRLQSQSITWIQNIVLRQQVLDFNKYSNGKFIAILLDLVLYKSQDLTDLGFEILCSYYT